MPVSAVRSMPSRARTDPNDFAALRRRSRSSVIRPEATGVRRAISVGLPTPPATAAAALLELRQAGNGHLRRPRLADTPRAFSDVGYEAPSPIQEQAIPELLTGRDVIGQAQTGTGKTAAFGLPMMQSIDPDDVETPGARAHPDARALHPGHPGPAHVRRARGIDPVAVFGGAPIRTQQAQLKQGAQVVVGTVGRVLDLISRHSLVLHSCRYVVLDEADEMLDLGFLEDVERILSLTPGRPPDRAVQRDDAGRSARSPSATCTTPSRSR